MDTHIHTYTQDNYSNPRYTCAPRVNEESLKAGISSFRILPRVLQCSLNSVSIYVLFLERDSFTRDNN